MSESNDNNFGKGIAAGLATAGVLVHVWFAVLMARMAGVFADFAAPIPTITRLVISPVWRWGVPMVGAIAVAGLIAARPRRLGPYVALAVLLATTIAMTWHFSQAPLTDLADSIKE